MPCGPSLHLARGSWLSRGLCHVSRITQEEIPANRIGKGFVDDPVYIADSCRAEASWTITPTIYEQRRVESLEIAYSELLELALSYSRHHVKTKVQFVRPVRGRAE